MKDAVKKMAMRVATISCFGSAGVAHAMPIPIIDGPAQVTPGSFNVFSAGNSSSTVPGSALVFSWDLDNDGAFDDGASTMVSLNVPADATVGTRHTIRLRVVDDTSSSAVTSHVVAVVSEPAESAAGLPFGSPAADVDAPQRMMRFLGASHRGISGMPLRAFPMTRENVDRGHMK